MAIAADEDYISQCRAQGLYPMAYYPHNLHFPLVCVDRRRQQQSRDRSGA
jgi:hypothetical protein